MYHPCLEVSAKQGQHMLFFSEFHAVFTRLTIGKFKLITSCRSQSLVKTLADWNMISKSRFIASAS